MMLDSIHFVVNMLKTNMNMLSIGPELEALHPQATSLDMVPVFYASTHQVMCKLVVGVTSRVFRSRILKSLNISNAARDWGVGKKQNAWTTWRMKSLKFDRLTASGLKTGASLEFECLRKESSLKVLKPWRRVRATDMRWRTQVSTRRPLGSRWEV